MPKIERLDLGRDRAACGRSLPGHPPSHGCVRLPMEFSRLLFRVTSLGSRVHIIADAPPSPTLALHFATRQEPSGRVALRLAGLRPWGTI